MLKEGKLEKIIGIVILAIVIVSALIVKTIVDNKNGKNLTVIYGAVGGGKEDFLADEEFNKILADKYKIKFIGDSWGNGSSIRKPLVRESVHLGNTRLSESELSIYNDSCSKYDLLFTSDERYLTEYREDADPSNGEADRYRVDKGSLTLNTPIIFYSWDTVTDALIKEGIVTKDEKTGVYFMSNPNKMINYILEGKKWKDIGLNNIYGSINITSVDPVKSSPGATYYGLLLAILTEQDETDEALNNALPTLKKIYEKAGKLQQTPADLFDMFLKVGEGTYPIIVDYEKSIIEFKNRDPESYNKIKDKLRLIYSIPTATNSHCIATFNEKGNEFLKAFDDKEIQDIAWKKYGFRVQGIGALGSVSVEGLPGVPESLSSIMGAKGLKMDTYNKLVNYLGEKEN